MDSSSLYSSFANLTVKELVLFATVLTISAIAISTCVQWYRLKHIPGPFIASFTSLWAYKSVSGMHYHEVIQETHERYGKVVRIAPNDVLVSDPDALWRINSARSSYSRGGWYGGIRFNPYGDSVFSEMNTAAHDKRKSKLFFGFSGKGLMDLEGSVDRQLAVLVDILKQKIRQGQGQAIVDIGRILQYFQVDLITDAGLGEPWGNMTANKDHHNYLATGDDLFPLVHSISMVPFLRAIFFSPMFLRFMGPGTTSGWLGVLYKEVDRRVKSDGSKQIKGDMLSEWLKHGLTPAEAELDLGLQLPAGTETSISTIRAIMMYLMTSPRCYQKLKREIAEGIQNGHISTPITSEEARNLPYLQAVINEGLRIAPPLVAGFPKTVPAGGDTICGKSVPAGTDIHMSSLALMRDQEVFGRDVELFRPERLIDCDDATKAKRLKVVDLNFGFGRWMCLGKALAWMEMNKIFVELLRSFDFQVLNPEKPWHRESTVTYYIKDFYASVTSDTINQAET